MEKVVEREVEVERVIEVEVEREVEQIVEVEKEVGVKQDEVERMQRELMTKAEREKQDLLDAQLKAREEKMRLNQQLNEVKQTFYAERDAIVRAKHRLKQLQSKLIHNGENLLDKTMAQDVQQQRLAAEMEERRLQQQVRAITLDGLGGEGGGGDEGDDTAPLAWGQTTSDQRIEQIARLTPAIIQFRCIRILSTSSTPCAVDLFR